jgi:hypothetical protein
MRLPDGLQLYRGLGGLTDLPASFFCRDKQGCRGYAEWAFMSTTADKAVAVHYSGVREGRPKAMVLVITVSAVDRGACVRDLSQVVLGQRRVACDLFWRSVPEVPGSSPVWTVFIAYTSLRAFAI